MNDQPSKSKLVSMCWNWKALVVLGVIGVGLFFILSPAQAFSVAPFLLFALCPLSMLLAARGMKGKGHTHNSCASCAHDHKIERTEAR